MQSSFGEELAIGDKIAGRYEVLSVLGKGSNGIVYKARHDILGRVVAIKTLRSHRIKDERSAKRFEREAKVACMVEHPNIMKVFDFGYKDEIPYLVMDFVSGIPLYNILKEERYITPERAVLLFSQVCDGLYHAHQRGVIHRDLKPANLMVVKKEHEPESVRIVDLGVAKILEEHETEAITKTGEVCGSPIYLSPEQCVYQELDARTDVYSLGVCLYESLTGVAPLRGATVYDTIYMHVNEIPKPLRQIAPELDIPPKIEQIVLRCLAKRPSDRYETMLELKQELITALKGGPAINVLPPEEFLSGSPSSPRVKSGPLNNSPAANELPRPGDSSTDEAPSSLGRRESASNSRHTPSSEHNRIARNSNPQLSSEFARISRQSSESERQARESCDPADSQKNQRQSGGRIERQRSDKASPGLADTIAQRIYQTDTTWRVIACVAIVLSISTAVGAVCYVCHIQQSVESRLRLAEQQRSKNDAREKNDDRNSPASLSNTKIIPNAKASAKSTSRSSPKQQPVKSTKAEEPGETPKSKKPEDSVKTAGKSKAPQKQGLQEGSAAMAFAPLQFPEVLSQPKEAANSPKSNQVKPEPRTQSSRVATSVDKKNEANTPGKLALKAMDAKIDPRAEQTEPAPANLNPAVITAPAALSLPENNSEIAEHYYRKGRDEFNSGNVTEAVKEFQKAYERYASDKYKSALASALTQCAYLCNKSADYAAAVTYQQRACDLYPGNEKYTQLLRGYQSNKQRGF